MNAHVTEWLSAYYDGELPEDRRVQVEQHMGQCPTCRAQLDELRKLSQLLQEAPVPDRVISDQRFQAQVKLRLPPAIILPGWQRALRSGWRLAPLGAVFLWAFAQAVLFLTTLTLVLNLLPGLGRTGVLDGLANLPGFMSFSGAESAVGLGLLNLAFTALVAVFLCGWIASWWVLRRTGQKDTPLLAFYQTGQG